MVDKELNNEQSCGKCGTHLTCRMSKATEGFASKLQWQNDDGSPHYKTKDGKTFTCNVPNTEHLGENIKIDSGKNNITTPDEVLIILEGYWTKCVGLGNKQSTSAGVQGKENYDRERLKLARMFMNNLVQMLGDVNKYK